MHCNNQPNAVRQAVQLTATSSQINCNKGSNILQQAVKQIATRDPTPQQQAVKHSATQLQCVKRIEEAVPKTSYVRMYACHARHPAKKHSNFV
jgi:hypothetical protein